MSNLTEPFLNPDTYLNHLTPEDGTRFEIVRTVHTAFLGAIVWDVIAFTPEDVKMLSQGRGGNLVTRACYLLARTLAILYVTLWVVQESRPISHCQTMTICISVVCVLAMATSSYLFLKRVQAVYSGNRWVQWGFALIYTCATISNIMLLFGMTTGHIQGTGYCTTYKVHLYVSIAYFVSGFFDTIVFLAISYKIAYQAHQNNLDTGGNWATRLFSVGMLPLFSKAVLQGGQWYYLVGVVTRLIALILMFTPSVPIIYRTIFMPPAVVMTAVTVCYVHRRMALAFYNTDEDGSDLVNKPVTTIRFAHNQPTAGEATSRIVIENLSRPGVVNLQNREVFGEKVEGPSLGTV